MTSKEHLEARGQDVELGEPFKYGRNRLPFQTVVRPCPHCGNGRLWRSGKGARAHYDCPACRRRVEVTSEQLSPGGCNLGAVVL